MVVEGMDEILKRMCSELLFGIHMVEVIVVPITKEDIEEVRRRMREEEEEEERFIREIRRYASVVSSMEEVVRRQAAAVFSAFCGTYSRIADSMYRRAEIMDERFFSGRDEDIKEIKEELRRKIDLLSRYDSFFSKILEEKEVSDEELRDFADNFSSFLAIPKELKKVREVLRKNRDVFWSLREHNG